MFWIPIIGDVAPGAATGTIEFFAVARIVQVVTSAVDARVDLDVTCD